MGCDIHLFTEQLLTVDSVTKFRNVDLFEFDYYDNNYRVKSIYTDRHYDAFAALADVRNSGHITPLAEPRGYPADVCQRTRDADRYGEDGHSHSHVTLQELYDYQDKYGTTTQTSMLTPDQAEQLDEEGILPTSWCKSTSWQDHVKRTWTRKESPLDRLIEVLEVRVRELCYIYHAEQKRVPQEQAEKFRIVFFFDN